MTVDLAIASEQMQDGGRSIQKALASAELDLKAVFVAPLNTEDAYFQKNDFSTSGIRCQFASGHQSAGNGFSKRNSAGTAVVQMTEVRRQKADNRRKN